jgi:N-acetylglucosamine-6-phosphate deacetylase
MPEGFFDLQVNGYAGVDFQDPDLTPAGLHAACQMLAAHGVGGFLATIITEHLDRMCACLRRLVGLREADPLARRLIAGFHIEGPFISPVDGYRGAHPLDGVRSADLDSAQRLLDAAGGLTRILTLAPEHDPGLRVTRFLADRGIIVSAGHCDPSLDELRAAVDAGLSMFTHLGNGCPMRMHRHDNIIQRVLALGEPLWITFIGDGAHIPFFALGNYLRLAGPQRCCLVSDAVAPAGLGPGRYTLGRRQIIVGDDMVAMAPDRSHFVGAAITMPQVHANLISRLGLSPDQALGLTSRNPRQAVSAR